MSQPSSLLKQTMKWNEGLTCNSASGCCWPHKPGSWSFRGGFHRSVSRHIEQSGVNGHHCNQPETVWNVYILKHAGPGWFAAVTPTTFDITTRLMIAHIKQLRRPVPTAASQAKPQRSRNSRLWKHLAYFEPNGFLDGSMEKRECIIYWTHTTREQEGRMMS